MTNAPTRRAQIEVEVTAEEWGLLVTEALEELSRTFTAVSETAAVAADSFTKVVKIWKELKQGS